MSEVTKLGLYLVLSLCILVGGLVLMNQKPESPSNEDSTKSYHAEVMAAALTLRIDQGLIFLQQELMQNKFSEDDPTKALCVIAMVSSFRKYSSSDGPWIRKPLKQVLQTQALPESEQLDRDSISFLMSEISNPTWNELGLGLLKRIPQITWTSKARSYIQLLKVYKRNPQKKLEVVISEFRDLAQDQGKLGAWNDDSGQSSTSITAQNIILFNLATVVLKKEVQTNN